MAKRSQANKLQQWIHEALQDAKAQDISMLDVRKISDFTDLMVVASGTSTRHVAAAAERVREVLREHGVRPVGMEGEKIGDWVLIDFGDAVVHIMRPQVRDFYNLEKLWADGKPVALEKPKAQLGHPWPAPLASATAPGVALPPASMRSSVRSAKVPRKTTKKAPRKKKASA